MLNTTVPTDNLKQSRPTKKAVYEPVTYSEALAVSLVLFARKDKDFSSILKKLVHKLSNISSVKSQLRSIDGVEILIPQDINTAMRRAEWLVGKIVENAPRRGLWRASRVLTSWAGEKELESPKQIVIGITIGIIPGLTLGNIRRKVTMKIIIRCDLAERTDCNVMHMVNKASCGIVERAIRTARGHAGKLEPEVSDWLFGDKEMSFYSADEKTLHKVGKELSRLDIPHIEVEDGGGMAVLAVSPAVNSEYIEASWKLELL